MKIETKYNFKDTVYLVSGRIQRIKVPTNCPICNDRGKIIVKEKEYTCPECRGYTYHTEEGDIEYYVHERQGKVGRITAEYYDEKYSKHNESKITYMLDITGVGSGTIWDENDLWFTIEEAQAECDRRNTKCE